MARGVNKVISKAKLDRVVQRIRKCLALAQSDNEHEAAAALRQAQKLMDEYRIDMGRAERSVLEASEGAKGRSSKATYTASERYLFAMIGDYFGCAAYIDGWGFPVFVGQSPAPQIAEYSAQSLIRQMRRNRTLALTKLKDELQEASGVQLMRKHVLEFNNSYTLAWVEAVRQKVADFAKGLSPETRRDIDQFVADELGRSIGGQAKEPSIGSLDTTMGQYAAGLGILDGKKAQLNHGIAPAESEQPRLNNVTTQGCRDGQAEF